MWKILTCAIAMSTGFIGLYAPIAASRTCFSTASPVVKHPAGLMGSKQLSILQTRKNTIAGKKLIEWTPLSFQPRVVEHVNVGKYGTGVGHAELVESGEKAYMFAVAYAMTGDGKYAAKTVEIVDAWSTKCKTFRGENSALEGSWFLSPMVRAVELVKYTRDKKLWNANVEHRFRKFVDLLLWRHVTQKLDFVNNWTLSKLEAELLYNLHRDNASILQNAAYRYKQQHKQFIDDKGVTSDLRRDLTHSQFSIGSLINAAEIFWRHQIDVYSYRNDLLARVMELNAGILLGDACPVKQNDPGMSWYQPVWAVGYNHYVARMGLSMPKTKRLMAKKYPEKQTFGWGLGDLTHTNTSVRAQCSF